MNLDDFEKAVVQKLLTAEVVDVNSFLEQIVGMRRVAYSGQTHHLDAYREGWRMETGQPVLVGESVEAAKDSAKTFVSLIKELEMNRLVLVNRPRLEQWALNGHEIIAPVENVAGAYQWRPEIYVILSSLDGCEIFTMPSLRAYVANGYLTADELRYRQERKEAREALDQAINSSNKSLELEMLSVTGAAKSLKTSEESLRQSRWLIYVSAAALVVTILSTVIFPLILNRPVVVKGVPVPPDTVVVRLASPDSLIDAHPRKSQAESLSKSNVKREEAK